MNECPSGRKHGEVLQHFQRAFGSKLDTFTSSVYLHLAAAHAHIREPSQSLFHMQPFDVIEEGPLRPRGNLAPVPKGPGIGVTLSRDRLDLCHRHFMEHGPYHKFHDPDRPGIFRRSAGLSRVYRV